MASSAGDADASQLRGRRPSAGLPDRLAADRFRLGSGVGTRALVCEKTAGSVAVGATLLGTRVRIAVGARHCAASPRFHVSITRRCVVAVGANIAPQDGCARGGFGNRTWSVARETAHAAEAPERSRKLVPTAGTSLEIRGVETDLGGNV